MITIKRYEPEAKEAWDAFVNVSKQGTFLFLRSYMDYHRNRFHDHSLMIYRNNKLYALLPGCEDKTTFYSHQGLTYGGLITSEKATTASICEIFHHVNEYLSSHHFLEVIYKPVPHIYHRLPADEDLYALFKECHAQIICRNISSTIDLHHPLKWRHIRQGGAKKANNQGITIKESDDLVSFWKILTENLALKHHSSPVHTVEEMTLLKGRFPNNIKLYAAFQNHKMIGGTLLYITPQVVHTQYISASIEGKQLHALDLLFHTLLNNTFKDFDYFDFGTSNEQQGKVLNEGLIYQKEGFGGRGVIYDTYKWRIA